MIVGIGTGLCVIERIGAMLGRRPRGSAATVVREA
jgi:hypothetical protein